MLGLLEDGVWWIHWLKETQVSEIMSRVVNAKGLYGELEYYETAEELVNEFINRNGYYFKFYNIEISGKEFKILAEYDYNSLCRFVKLRGL